MDTTRNPDTGAGGRASAWIAPVACLTALLGLTWLALPRLPAADTWWSLACGRLLVETRGLVYVDPFSFGSGRVPWLNHEWLAQAIFYRLFLAVGEDGLFLFRTAVVVLAFGVLPLLGARLRGVPAVQAAVVVLACAAAAEGWAFFDARAYLFSYLGLSCTLLLASEALRTSNRWILLGIPPVILVWANCHGGFVLGPVALAAAAAGSLWDRREARLAGAFTAAALGSLALAAVGTPYGLEILKFPFSLMVPSAFSIGLNEWARPDLLAQWPYSLLLLASALLGRRADPVRRVWLVVFLGAGLVAWRHAPLGALAAAHVLPGLLPRYGSTKALRPELTLALWMAGAALSGWAVAGRLEEGAREWTMTRTHFPVAATRFLVANPRLPRDLFNPYEWGGYLDWVAWPKHRVFVDGRANTVFSERRYAEALCVQFGDPWVKALGRAGLGRALGANRHWEAILEEYGVRMVLCSRIQGDLFQRLSSSHRWFPVYSDPLSAVFLRDDVEGRAAAGSLVHPLSPWICMERSLDALHRGRETVALDWIVRAIAWEPHWAQPRVVHGALLLRSGREAEGEAELRVALRLDPWVPEAHFNLAMLAFNRGDAERARQELLRELSSNPEHPQAGRMLQSLGGGGYRGAVERPSVPVDLLQANPFSLFVVFLYGSLFGSFLNVVIYRMPLERSVVAPGSACGTCGTPLVWWQNIPILSYLLLRGRCHTCGSTFSIRYACLEALTGAAAAGLLYHHGQLGFPFFYHFVFFCFLTVIFFMDLDHWIILDQVSVSGMVVGFLGAALMPSRGDLLVDPAFSAGAANLLSSLLGILVGAAFFWSIQVVGTILARQEALGGGDIKLAAMMGAFLGWKMGLVSYLGSFILGAAVAVPLMIGRRRRGKDPVPLGTFMAAAAFLTALWGEQIFQFLLEWPERLGLGG